MQFEYFTDRNANVFPIPYIIPPNSCPIWFQKRLGFIPVMIMERQENFFAVLIHREKTAETAQKKAQNTRKIDLYADLAEQAADWGSLTAKFVISGEALLRLQANALACAGFWPHETVAVHHCQCFLYFQKVFSSNCSVYFVKMRSNSTISLLDKDMYFGFHSPFQPTRVS